MSRASRSTALAAALVVLALLGWLVLRDGSAGEGPAVRQGLTHPVAHPGTGGAEPQDPQGGEAGRGETAGSDTQRAPLPGLAAEERLEVLVLHVDGAPAQDIVVRARRGDRWLAGASTDGDGRAWLERPRGNLEVFALTPLGKPVMRVLQRGERRTELQLDDAAEVSGRVLVHDQVPTAPLQIALYSPRIPRFPAFLSVEEQRIFAEVQTYQIQRTLEDGSFHFRVPADFRGNLSFPDLRWKIDGASSRERGPERDILLRLTSRPTLRGRLLGLDGARTTQGGSARLVVPTARRNVVHGARVGTDGSFEVAFDAGEARAAELSLAGPGREGRAVRAVELAWADLDLGEVALEPGERLRFRALTPERAPLAGVVATTSELAPSAPTAADGRGSVQVWPGPDGSVSVSFDLEGYEARTLRAMPPRSAELEVVLEPTTRLELLLAARGGGSLFSPASALLLVLSSPEPVLEQKGKSASFELSWHPDHHEVRRPGDVHPRAERTELRWTLRGAGLHALENLPAETPLDLGVEDLSEVRIWSAEGIVLLPGHPRRLEITLDPPRTILLDVIDGHGEPVQNAKVLVIPPGGARELSRGPAGDLQPLEVRCESVTIFASAEGFAPLTLPDVPVPPAGLELDIVLRAGHPVRVEVLDSAGDRIEHVTVNLVVELPALPLPPEARGRYPVGRAELLEPGLFFLRSAPHDAFEVAITGQGRHFLREIEAGTDHARVTLPSPGVLEITWSGTTRTGASVVIELGAPDDAGGDPRDPAGVQGKPLRSSTQATERGVLEPLTFPAVFPGRYRLRVRDDEGAVFERTIEVSAAQTVQLELAPPAAH